MRELWWSGRKDKAAQVMNDEILTTFGLGYREEDIRSRIRRYLDAGVTPILDAYGVRKGHEREDIARIVEIGISART